MDKLKKIIYGRIGEGDVEGAIDLLMETLQQRHDDNTYKDALFLKSNLHTAKQQYEIKGVIVRQEYELVVNKTLLGLERILDELGNLSSEVVEQRPNKRLSEPPAKSRPFFGSPLFIGLTFVAVLVGVIFFVLQNKLFISKTDPLPEILAHWEEGNYETIFEELEFLQENGTPEQQDLAAGRFHWLSSVGMVSYFFIDDFEKHPTNHNWIFDPGVPGPGEHHVLPTEEGHILQLQGHVHGNPAVPLPDQGEREIWFRFRMVSEEPASLHVNLCMELPEPYPRTTVGLYQESSLVNIWENPDESFEKKITFKSGKWYQFRAILSDAAIELILDDQPIIHYESRRGNIPLNHFNFESVVGIIEIDNVLVFGR